MFNHSSQVYQHLTLFSCDASRLCVDRTQHANGLAAGKAQRHTRKKTDTRVAGNCWGLQKLRIQSRVANDEWTVTLKRMTIEGTQVSRDVPVSTTCRHDVQLAHVIEKHGGNRHIQRTRSDSAHTLKVLVVFA